MYIRAKDETGNQIEFKAEDKIEITIKAKKSTAVVRDTSSETGGETEETVTPPVTTVEKPKVSTPKVAEKTDTKKGKTSTPTVVVPVMPVEKEGKKSKPENADTVMFEDVYKASNFKSTTCLLYTSPSPRDRTRSRMPSSA